MMATPHFFKTGNILILNVGDALTTLSILKNVLGNQFAGK